MNDKDNKLIAEFMSIKYDADDETFHTNEGWKGVDYLMYHTSWDWLMPVVIKIAPLTEHGIKIENHETIQSAYSFVVEFIEDYNDER